MTYLRVNVHKKLKLTGQKRQFQRSISNTCIGFKLDDATACDTSVEQYFW